MHARFEEAEEQTKINGGTLPKATAKIGGATCRSSSDLCDFSYTQ
jgi:hypothetical protein